MPPKARPGFQETDVTAKPGGTSRPRPGSGGGRLDTSPGQSKPRPGSGQTIDGSPGASSGGSKPRPGAGSGGQTFVPSDLSDPTTAAQGQDGFTVTQYQPGLSLTAKLAIGATVLVGLFGLAWTVRRRVRGDVRE